MRHGSTCSTPAATAHVEVSLRACPRVAAAWRLRRTQGLTAPAPDVVSAGSSDLPSGYRPRSGPNRSEHEETHRRSALPSPLRRGEGACHQASLSTQVEDHAGLSRLAARHDGDRRTQLQTWPARSSRSASPISSLPSPGAAISPGIANVSSVHGLKTSSSRPHRPPHFCRTRTPVFSLMPCCRHRVIPRRSSAPGLCAFSFSTIVQRCCRR